MTIAELQRAIDSKLRVKKTEQREKAKFDYILADLIGRSVGRLYNEQNSYPEISEVYPSLFSNKEVKERQEQQKAEVSAIRFIQFAQSFNQRFKEVEKGNE